MVHEAGLSTTSASNDAKERANKINSIIESVWVDRWSVAYSYPGHPGADAAWVCGVFREEEKCLGLLEGCPQSQVSDLILYTNLVKLLEGFDDHSVGGRALQHAANLEALLFRWARAPYVSEPSRVRIRG